MLGHKLNCYLYHLEEPIGTPQSEEQRKAHGLPPRMKENHHTAGHYIGCTAFLKRRFKEHARGEGSALLAAALELGINFRPVRIWPGMGFDFEGYLKSQHDAARLCPICNPERWPNSCPGEGSVLVINTAP